MPGRVWEGPLSEHARSVHAGMGTVGELIGNSWGTVGEVVGTVGELMGTVGEVVGNGVCVGFSGVGALWSWDAESFGDTWKPMELCHLVGSCFLCFYCQQLCRLGPGPGPGPSSFFLNPEFTTTLN
jgi:hypothetical protein